MDRFLTSRTLRASGRDLGEAVGALGLDGREQFQFLVQQQVRVRRGQLRIGEDGGLVVVLLGEDITVGGADAVELVRFHHRRLGHGGGHLSVDGGGTHRSAGNNSRRAVVVLHSSRLAQLRVHHGVGEALGQDVQGQHGEQDGQAGEGGGPPAAGQDQVAAVGDHVAPGRCGVLDAGAEEGQRGFEDDGVGHHHRGEHQHRGGGVADDVLEQDVEAAGADHALGTDVVLAVLGEHVGADHAGQLRACR